jgi:hypothetical protein
MSDLVPTRDNLVGGGRRPLESPLLSVLSFRATAGTQEAGADNPQVASFNPSTPITPTPPGIPSLPGIIPKGTAFCDGPSPGPGAGPTGGKGGVASDFASFCIATS